MKKRVLSMLLAFILCFSTLPMTAFAQEDVQEAGVVTEQEADSAEEQEGAEAAAAPGAETSSDKRTTVEAPDKSVSDSNAGTQDTVADDEKKAAVQAVQALINALPETVTEDNAESVGEQLEAIAEAMESLTEEQIVELDMERFDAICAALTGLVAVQAEEHVHPICGTTCNDGKNHQNVTWTATKELTNDMAAGNYYLTTDITLSQPWVPKNNVNLCLNGHNITFTKNTSYGDYNVIVIENIGLNLCDAHGQGTVIAEKGASGDICGGVDIEENGVFNLYDGAKINAHDWGVWINSQGSFTMYGGTVTGKEREGVHVSQAAEFNMKGGEIRDCEIGGGVLVMGRSTSNSNSLVGGRFEMTGGKICNNTSAGAENGGGVTVLYGQYGSGIFNMEGGEISDNKAKNGNGGGVYIKCNADASYYPGRFTMLGGTISGNTAKNGKGGGVYVETDQSTKDVAMFIFGRDAKITNNTDSNVYLCDNNTIVISWYGLKSGASMGVTLEKLPAEGDYTVFATDANQGYVENAITSDNDNYKIMRSDNEVIIYSKTTELHAHPVCGKTCNHDDAHADEVWRGVSSLDEITTSGNYYLTQNIELNKTWSPVAGVKLCLNGHNITANADVDVITMPNSGNFMIFTLTDCMGKNGTTYGKITHTEGKEGHGIYVKNRVVMYGGEISGNTVGTYGNGGGVYVYDFCDFEMHGGSITGNSAGDGGGVYFRERGSFTMDGGSITDNSASRSGGGVYLSQGSFTVSGKAKITNNTLSDNATANNVGGWGYSIKVDIPGLDNTASIGVTTSDIAEGSYVVVAEGIEAYKKSYQLKETDLNCFRSDVAGYTPKLINNSIVFTNGNMHEHAICGDADCKDGHDDALWLPLTYDNDTQTLKYGSQIVSSTVTKFPTTGEYYMTYTLPAGNYYLADNIEMNGGSTIYNGDMVTSKGGVIKIGTGVNLCLNGKKLSTSESHFGVIVIENAGTLTLSDCQTGGQISSNCNAFTGVQITLGDTSRHNTFTMYGGKITGTETGVFMNSESIFNMYGGTISGNETGVNVFPTSKLTVGGSADIIDNTEKNVLLNGNAKITIDSSLTNYARIGVTTENRPVDNKPIQIATGATGWVLYTQIFKPDEANQGYVVTVDEQGNLYLNSHIHNWLYEQSADGQTITANCDVTGCPKSDGGSVTIKKPEHEAYDDGKTPEATLNEFNWQAETVSKIKYQRAGKILDEAPTDAGTYWASIKIGNQSAIVRYTINSKNVTKPTITVNGTYTYDGTAKTPSVTVKDGDKEIPSTEYRVSYENNINAGTAIVKITDVDGGNYNVSGSTTFTIDKATITVTPTAGQTTIYGMSDPTLEYSSSGAMAGETPDFTGALSRKAGKDAGSYEITGGKLELADNGGFKAANYELKLADTPVQFTIVPKTLSAEDLEFITDSPITKTYDGTTACGTATVRIKSSAIAYDNDVLPTVKGTYAYNSANVTEANEVIFTSEASGNQNYILPAGLKLGHAANITKADQAALTITSTSATYGTDLTLTVDGGSGNGALTYTVENGTGAATIIGSTLQPVRAGQVKVQATKSGDDNHNEVKSSETVIIINKGTYPGTVSKTINIMRNRSDVQEGSLFVEDFFPKGQVPEDACIRGPKKDSGEIVTVKQLIHSFEGYILGYTSAVNITSTTDQTCKVTISSANYEDIEATLIFHPTDKTTVTIEGLTYTGKTYDGSAIQPTGTLQVTGGNVPANKLEVLYEGTSANGTNYSSSYAPKDAGTYKVTYKVADSNENYTGSVEYTFTISPKNVTAGMIGTITAQEYTGSAITPEPVVKNGEVTLVSGKDFDFSYDKNINAGENTATVTISGKGNYTGTASQTFTIKPKDIKGAVIKLQADSLGYTGLMQEAQITSVTLDQVTLTANDYDIVNNSNKRTNADDSITLTIAGKGNYTGTATTTWKITKATPELRNFDVTPDLSQKQTYDGKPKEVTAKTKNGVIDMGNVTVCYEGTDGTAYTRSETAPTNAGSYKVILSVVEGKNYTAAEIEAGTLTIKKAAAPTLADVEVDHAYATTGNQTVSLAELVKSAKSYTLGEITGNTETEILSDINVTGDGVLQYTLTGKGAAGSTVTIPVTIASTNYEETRVNVVITIKQATPTGAPGYEFIHDSSKTLKDAGLDLINSTLNPKEGKLEWIDSNGKVLPGETKLEEGKKYIWRFTPVDPNYATITGELELYAPYRILDGADSTWTQSTDGTIAIRGNGDFEKFQSVKVDGIVVDAKNYTVAKGSTIITFKGDYLKTLSTGSHTFELVWTDGSATTNFTIAAKPDNGDNNNDSNDDSDNDITVNGNVSSGNNTVPAAIGAPKTGDASGIWMTLFAVSLAGLAAMLVRKKNNRE